ncbi:AlpA family phage regulatory protein [Vibrio sp. Sgm 5]|uniref:AlpA family phage regulatory protein n=1 Tax=Vibrio sp. Sgm 5 TaxID=2994387 RepID=UPI002248F0B8|nr:AlpA family phage regulatory protein [Vibrio sp. Sgm 5]MCX2788329.1 AlpA family phage regulatory protein [Vibrio sp. Sgm 5]
MSLRIIRLKEVIALTGLSKSSIYRYADGKAFPQSVQLGARSVGWMVVLVGVVRTKAIRTIEQW